MTSFIQFSDDVLVEVDRIEVQQEEGSIKAGLGDYVSTGLAKAQASFENALESVVKKNAQALINAVDSLPKAPSEVELSFGIKATGEAGNLAIAKASGEANYSIKLVWKPSSKNQ